jgi:signal transduction histidine kinase
MTVRARLTALYAVLFGIAALLLLAVSYGLLRAHLSATLPPQLARQALADVATQYALAFAGTMLVAVALGWAVAGRVLEPLKAIASTARDVTDERLDRRVGLHGADDELRDLADTVDRMLDRLERSFEAQRRFAANASHELRTPLTIIRSEAEVALANPEPDVDELRAMGAAVVRAAGRTEELLDGLLLLARSRRELLRTERLDLADVARAARPGVGAAAAGLDLRMAAGRAEVEGDAVLLQRLLENLLENAVRHNQPGGWVRAATGAVGDRAVIEVVNSGRLIAPDELPRLIEPFERVGGRGRGGAGLGLSVVRAVADAHDGEVELSARPTGGLDVRVSLPLAPGAAPQKSLAGGPERAPRWQPRPPASAAGRSSR